MPSPWAEFKSRANMDYGGLTITRTNTITITIINIMRRLYQCLINSFTNPQHRVSVMAGRFNVLAFAIDGQTHPTLLLASIGHA